jgi:hypothetical protein
MRDVAWQLGQATPIFSGCLRLGGVALGGRPGFVSVNVLASFFACKNPGVEQQQRRDSDAYVWGQ